MCRGQSNVGHPTGNTVADPHNERRCTAGHTRAHPAPSHSPTTSSQTSPRCPNPYNPPPTTRPCCPPSPPSSPAPDTLAPQHPDAAHAAAAVCTRAPDSRPRPQTATRLPGRCRCCRRRLGPICWLGRRRGRARDRGRSILGRCSICACASGWRGG